jgi:ABC-type dipeptide/oligopeptide/nickel transport system permease subunit
MLRNAANAAVEGFLNGNVDQKRQAYADFVAAVLAYIIAIILIALIGKYLWNGIVVDLVSIAKPAKSFWQILGLMIFISIMLP